jgi:hypothetical protein
MFDIITFGKPIADIDSIYIRGLACHFLTTGLISDVDTSRVPWGTTLEGATTSTVLMVVLWPIMVCGIIVSYISNVP